MTIIITTLSKPQTLNPKPPPFWLKLFFGSCSFVSSCFLPRCFALGVEPGTAAAKVPSSAAPKGARIRSRPGRSMLFARLLEQEQVVRITSAAGHSCVRPRGHGDNRSLQRPPISDGATLSSFRLLRAEGGNPGARGGGKARVSSGYQVECLGGASGGPFRPRRCKSKRILRQKKKRKVPEDHITREEG